MSGGSQALLLVSLPHKPHGGREGPRARPSSLSVTAFLELRAGWKILSVHYQTWHARVIPKFLKLFHSRTPCRAILMPFTGLFISRPVFFASWPLRWEIVLLALALSPTRVCGSCHGSARTFRECLRIAAPPYIYVHYALIRARALGYGAQSSSLTSFSHLGLFGACSVLARSLGHGDPAPLVLSS